MNRGSLKRLSAGILAVILIIGLAVVPVGKGSAAALKLNKKSLSLKVGKSAKLVVKGKYSGKVKWSSSKKSIAKVNAKGLVKAVKAGKAVITAKVGGKKLKCKVTVTGNKNSTDAGTVVPTPDPAAANNVSVPADNNANQVASPTEAPPEDTPAPTDPPTPSPTPKYMQEGAFVYEALDTSWIDPEKPMVAFTFDDGPVGNSENSSSMRILNTLKEYGMHATFNYITGIINNDGKRAEILRSLEDGNEIGNHTTGYNSLSSYSASQIASDVEKARQTLEDITGLTSFTLRPPNLALNNDVYHNVPVPMIGCNVYSMDWEGKSTQEIINNVKNAKDGDIVLMHETYATTAEAVEYLVPYFVDKGYQIVSVVELYAVKDIPLFPGFYYNCTTKDPDKPSN